MCRDVFNVKNFKAKGSSDLDRKTAQLERRRGSDVNPRHARSTKILLLSKRDKDKIFCHLRKIRTAYEEYKRLSSTHDHLKEMRDQIRQTVSQAREKNGEAAKNFTDKLRGPPPSIKSRERNDRRTRSQTMWVDGRSKRWKLEKDIMTCHFQSSMLCRLNRRTLNLMLQLRNLIFANAGDRGVISFPIHRGEFLNGISEQLGTR